MYTKIMCGSEFTFPKGEVLMAHKHVFGIHKEGLSLKLVKVDNVLHSPHTVAATAQIP